MKLKSYLAESEMSMKDFCSILEYDPRYMSRVANGHVKPSKQLAQSIADLTEGKVNFIEKNLNTTR